MGIVVNFDRYAFLTILMEGAHKTGLTAHLSEPLYDLADKHYTSGVVQKWQTETQWQATVLRHFLASYPLSKEEMAFLHPLLDELEL